MNRHSYSMGILNKGSKAALVLALWTSLLVSLPSHGHFLETTSSRSLFQLQAYKDEITANYENSALVSASLINLNSNINSWYILDVVDKNKSEHIYNILAISDASKLRLDTSSPELIIINDNIAYKCDINNEIINTFGRSSGTRSSYLAVCNDLLLLKIKQDGHQSTIEKGAEALRWLAGESGESVINEVKETLFKDRYLVKEETQDSQGLSAAPGMNTPLPRASIQNKYENTSIPATFLGLKAESSEKIFLAGCWYPLKNFKGVYASMIEPRMASQQILDSHLDRVNPLDGVENNGVVYLMSLSLNKYTMGWGHGTDHPGVGWSERAKNIIKDNPLGPDGFNTASPLVFLGHVPPSLWPKTMGTFSGGFQKRHSAFRYGELSESDKAHHYGFMENGVILVSPSEGLATIIIYGDGSIDLKTWAKEDNQKLHLTKHFRQNGVPLIDRDEKGQGIPGRHVKSWGNGNWSGSADRELRTVRGAACIIETPQDKYLVYAYFSGATPSAMARVFQAYGCNYAIHLDMNSPGQAYASLFTKYGSDSTFKIENLVTSMNGGDSSGTPRYLIKPDYKDFFYIMKKD